jgi:hypothetical protein
LFNNIWSTCSGLTSAFQMEKLYYSLYLFSYGNKESFISFHVLLVIHFTCIVRVKTIYLVIYLRLYVFVSKLMKRARSDGSILNKSKLSISSNGPNGILKLAFTGSKNEGQRPNRSSDTACDNGMSKSRLVYAIWILKLHLSCSSFSSRVIILKYTF